MDGSERIAKGERVAKPVHVEIPAKDTQRALKFYGDLFGWQFQAFEGSPQEYHMTRFSEDSGGAIFPGATGGGVRVYFDVDDSDAGRARVNELGGSADEKMPVPGMGWFVTCTDTEGNPFGLWQNDPDAQMPQQ
jgi:predicted enzyme related to lactoylglutathione lyase